MHMHTAPDVMIQKKTSINKKMIAEHNTLVINNPASSPTEEGSFHFNNRHEMVEDDSKKNADGSVRKSSKSIKDMNRELRNKIASISKSLLNNRSKKLQRSQIIRLDPALFARPPQQQPQQNPAPPPPPPLPPPPAPPPLKPATKNEVITSARAPKRTAAPGQDQKKEAAVTQQDSKTTKASSKESTTSATSAPLTPSSRTPVQKEKSAKKKKKETDALDFSTSSKSESRKAKHKAIPEVKFEKKKPKMKKFYTEKQLKKMINKLYKQTKEIRAADPAVDELLKETRETIKAIEQLEKLFIHIHEESKARTKKLVDDFEKLKNMRIRHGRELDTQIAQQVRTEMDTKKELAEMLNDENVKMLMAKSSKRREHPEQQRSFIVRMLRSLVGL